MSIKPAKSASATSNKPLVFLTRLATPRASTPSHQNFIFETGSSISKQSNISRKRKKIKSSKTTVHSETVPAVKDYRQGKNIPIASEIANPNTAVLPVRARSSPISTMAQQPNRAGNRNSDRYNKDKSDTKFYEMGEDIDEKLDLSSPRHHESSLTLFEAARELQRRHVTVKGISLHNLQSLTAPTASYNSSARAERDKSNTPGSRQGQGQDLNTPTFPEHLLSPNLESSQSIQDIALRTVLNAGATVDFVASPYGAASLHMANGTYHCIECNEKFSSEAEHEIHISWQDRYCSFCMTRFKCRGLFESDAHECARSFKGRGGAGNSSGRRKMTN